MPIVDYKAPVSVDEAITMLADCNTDVKVLAGGTDLIIQARPASSNPLTVIDVKYIDSMMTASVDSDGLTLGPAMSCAEFTARDDIKAIYPGLVEAAYLIGSTQVQGRASVGGNLSNASPAADTIPPLIANGARCVVAGPDGERDVAVEDFVVGVGNNCMLAGELLKKIHLPLPQARTSDAYLRFIPRTEMDIAVAGAGVSITLNSDGLCTAARVAIGAVAVTALLVPAAAEALIGTKLEDSALQAAASAASAASKPISDRRGTADYRRHVVGVLVKRAASIAAQRAQEK
ncbi:MAG: xanthine dehydrogenase family protein subunit M [Oceanicoccus sp.]